MYGIRQGPPEYALALLQLAPDLVSVRARLTDPRLRFAAGKVNSFPNSLRTDHRFPAPIATVYRRLDGQRLEVYAFEPGVADTRALRRDTLLRHLARP